MRLKGKRIAILAEDMYNEFELWIPYYRFKEEGAEIIIVGTGTSAVYHGKYGIPVNVDKTASEMNVDELDAIVIPGGYAPDKMRIHHEMVGLVKSAFEKGKIISSICHGGWMLVSANIIRNKWVTSYVAIRDDMVNAGALWQDEELVRDGNIITSRKPDDLPAFCRATIEALEGK